MNHNKKSVYSRFLSLKQLQKYRMYRQTIKQSPISSEQSSDINPSHHSLSQSMFRSGIQQINGVKLFDDIDEHLLKNPYNKLSQYEARQNFGNQPYDVFDSIVGNWELNDKEIQQTRKNKQLAADIDKLHKVINCKKLELAEIVSKRQALRQITKQHDNLYDIKNFDRKIPTLQQAMEQNKWFQQKQIQRQQQEYAYNLLIKSQQTKNEDLKKQVQETKKQVKMYQQKKIKLKNSSDLMNKQIQKIEKNRKQQTQAMMLQNIQKQEREIRKLQENISRMQNILAK